MGQEQFQKSPRRQKHGQCTPSPDPKGRNGSHAPPEASRSAWREGNEEATPLPPKKKNPLSARILDGRNPRSLGKHPKLQD